MFEAEELVETERERHMQLLARSVTSLKTGLETQEKVASLHYLGSLAENTELLSEVNQLRREVSKYFVLVNKALITLLRIDPHTGDGKSETDSTSPV